MSICTLFNRQSHEGCEDHRLSWINDCSPQIFCISKKPIHTGAAKVRFFQLGAGHFGVPEVAALQDSAPQVTTLKVGFFKVARVEFAGLENPQSETDYKQRHLQRSKGAGTRLERREIP